MITNKKEHYTDKALRLAIALQDAMHADTAYTVPGKRLITRRKNVLIRHVGGMEKALIWLEQVDTDDDLPTPWPPHAWRPGAHPESAQRAAVRVVQRGRADGVVVVAVCVPPVRGLPADCGAGDGVGAERIV